MNTAFYENMGAAAAMEDIREGNFGDVAPGDLWQHLELDDGGREYAAIVRGEVGCVTVDEARDAVLRGYREMMCVA